MSLLTWFQSKVKIFEVKCVLHDVESSHTAKESTYNGIISIWPFFVESLSFRLIKEPPINSCRGGERDSDSERQKTTKTYFNQATLFIQLSFAFVASVLSASSLNFNSYWVKIIHSYTKRYSKRRKRSDKKKNRERRMEIDWKKMLKTHAMDRVKTKEKICFFKHELCM